MALDVPAHAPARELFYEPFSTPRFAQLPPAPLSGSLSGGLDHG